MVNFVLGLEVTTFHKPTPHLAPATPLHHFDTHIAYLLIKLGIQLGIQWAFNLGIQTGHPIWHLNWAFTLILLRLLTLFKIPV